jgi:outer membrane protein
VLRAAPLLVLLSVTVHAQTSVPLDEALRLARTQAADVLRADADVLASRASVDAAADRRWPSLSVRAGGGQRYGLAFDQTSGDLTQATVESVDLGLDADYVVYDGGARSADARAANAGLDAARLGRERAARRAEAAVVEGYLAAARARAARDVAGADLEAQRDLLAVVVAQVELGERSASETAQQEERVAAARGAVLSAERDLALAEARLVRLLGLDPVGEYAFPAPSGETVPTAPVDTDALVREALGQRADLRAAEAAVRAAEAERGAARAGRLPQVSLGVYVGTGYSSAAGTSIPGQFGDNRAGALRLSVSLPVLDRGTAGAAVARADAQAAALRASVEDARRQAALDVRERAIALDALVARSEVVEARVRAARVALDAERARYEAGAATLQDVTLLQARLTDALTERATIAVEAAFAPALLDVAVGR